MGPFNDYLKLQKGFLNLRLLIVNKLLRIPLPVSFCNDLIKNRLNLEFANFQKETCTKVYVLMKAMYVHELTTAIIDEHCNGILKNLFLLSKNLTFMWDSLRYFVIFHYALGKSCSPSSPRFFFFLLSRIPYTASLCTNIVWSLFHEWELVFFIDEGRYRFENSKKISKIPLMVYYTHLKSNDTFLWDK